MTYCEVIHCSVQALSLQVLGENTRHLGQTVQVCTILGTIFEPSTSKYEARISATARSYGTSWCLNLDVPWRGTDWSAMPSWKIVIFYGTPPGVLLGHHIHICYTPFDARSRRSSFAQRVIWYKYGQFVYAQVSPYEIETPAHWNMICRSVTAQPPMCYCPAVFFLVLRFIALAFMQG